MNFHSALIDFSIICQWTYNFLSSYNFYKFCIEYVSIIRTDLTYMLYAVVFEVLLNNLF